MRHQLRLQLGALVSLTLVILVGYWSLITVGLPETHDGQIHTARIAQYYLAFQQGQWPPRWAPNANAGFGYPVFNFNYPLPYILGLLLIKAQLSVEAAATTIWLTALVTAGWGMYWLLKSYLTTKAAFLGGWLYALSNYALLLVYVRGGAGEIIAYALFPWLFYSFERLIRAGGGWRQFIFWGASLIWAMFLLSHNIMVLFGTPLFLGFLLFRTRKKLSTWRQLGPPLVLGLSLAAFFWIPAVSEGQATIIRQSPLSHIYQQHFPTLKQLVYDAWDYGYSRPGPVDGISFNLNPIWLLILGLGFIGISFRAKPAGIKWLYGGMVGWGVAMLPLSSWWWQNLPLVNYIQFPWRLLFFWPMLAVPVMAWLFDQTKNHWGWWCGLVIILGASMATKNQAQNTYFFPDQYWFQTTTTTSLMDENMPRWFNKGTNYGLDASLFSAHPVACSEPVCQFSFKIWTGTARNYQVFNTARTRVIERIAYFPGMKVWVDNEFTQIDYQEPAYPGLVSYRLPAGAHTVGTRFTQDTWPRKLGNTISLMAVLVWLFGFAWVLKLNW